MTSKQFGGQRVCIVGGTAGMGLAIARRLAREGADVVIAGRDLDRARRIAIGIGPSVKGRAVDVMHQESIASFFDDLGIIDHLVVAAAKVSGGRFGQESFDQARESFDGKFWAQWLCAHYAKVSRSILLFSGILSRKPSPGLTTAGAINGAVEALGRSLAIELAPIRVNVISPGLIQGTDASRDMPQEVVRTMVEGAASRLPVGLVGDADSVAGLAISVLASPYMTGTVVDIDGGALLAG
jgi:NAD(P)-dependent dehydrogenase (short-subunit alcohol dehydrogenase family)